MSSESAPVNQERPVNVPGFTKSYTRRDQDRGWVLIDAKGHTVGRLATRIADILRGKHKPTFTRHDDVGDFVVVINAEHLELRGNDKPRKKQYVWHTPWYGHLKQRSGAEVLADRPEMVLRLAVNGMISSGALKNRLMKKLKIYRGAEHPHKAQRPVLVDIPKPQQAGTR